MFRTHNIRHDNCELNEESKREKKTTNQPTSTQSKREREGRRELNKH